MTAKTGRVDRIVDKPIDKIVDNTVDKIVDKTAENKPLAIAETGGFSA